MTKTIEYRLDLESAEHEFDKFVDMMDLDLDVADMDDADKKDFTREKDRIIKALRIGSLEINDNGEPVFTPVRSENKEPITFYEATGESLMAMDRKKKNADVTKMMASMAQITKQAVSRFAKMKMNDINVCTAITTLFLG